METNLLDTMLSAYCSQRTVVTIVLQSRSRLTGTIETFDSYVIILGGQKQEIVYRHAVSSVLPYAVAEQSPGAERKPVQAKPSAKPAPASRPASRPQPKREQRPAPKTAPAAAEPSLNTGMKEGLLRWMQEQKVGK